MKSLTILLDDLKHSDYKAKIIENSIGKTFGVETRFEEPRVNLGWGYQDNVNEAVLDKLCDYNKPVFLITDKPIISIDFLFEYDFRAGQVHSESAAGFESTFPFDNPEDIGIITQVALHETGHLMGLGHHEKKAGKKYCLMKQNEWENFYDYIDNVSSRLCKGCKKQLGLYESPVKKILDKSTRFYKLVLNHA